MEWTPGATYYGGENIKYIAAFVDPRGCFQQVVVTEGGRIFHMVRGRKGPHPVQSREIIPVARAIGNPTITFSPLLGIVEISCPLEGIGVFMWASPLAEIPDPSGPELVPFA